MPKKAHLVGENIVTPVRRVCEHGKGDEDITRRESAHGGAAHGGSGSLANCSGEEQTPSVDG